MTRRKVSRSPSDINASNSYLACSLKTGRLSVGQVTGSRSATPQAVEDLLTIQAVFATERTWCQPSPLVSPDRMRAMSRRGELTPAKRAEYRKALDGLRAIEARHREPQSGGEKELRRITRWVLDQWDERDREPLGPGQ